MVQKNKCINMISYEVTVVIIFNTFKITGTGTNSRAPASALEQWQENEPNMDVSLVFLA